MQAVHLIGGENTATSRTITINCYTDITISDITIPITLEDTTTATKNATITVTAGVFVATETAQYTETETGSRTITVNVGHTVPAYSSYTIRFSGSRCYVNYGTSTAYSTTGQMVVTNGFECILNVDVTNIWQIDTNNGGYPCPIGVTVDNSVFSGYQPPKPLNSWKLDANNGGYPWTWGFTEIQTGQNIFLKTTDGLVPLVAYYNDGEDRLIPLTFIKLT